MKVLLRAAFAAALLGTSACGAEGEVGEEPEGLAADEIASTARAIRARRMLELVNIRDRTADATFRSESGCISFDTQVIAFTHAERVFPEPAVEDGAVAVVFARAFDNCLGAALSEGTATLQDPSGLTISPNLDSGSVHATVEGINLSNGSLITYAIDLDWEADGPREVERLRTVDRETPGVVVRYRGKSVARTAVATGSVTDGEFEYANGPSESASLSDIQQATMTITRTNAQAD